MNLRLHHGIVVVSLIRRCHVRAQVTKTLRGGVMNGADSAAGWKALAELQYQNR